MQLGPLTLYRDSWRNEIQVFFADGFVGSLPVVNDYAIYGCPVDWPALLHSIGPNRRDESSI